MVLFSLKNTLFYTNFSVASTDAFVQILYEFTDQDDEDANQVRNQLLALPLDPIPSAISLFSAQELDDLRIKIGMQAIHGVVVDLNWPKINFELIKLLVQQGLLECSTTSEQFLFELLEQKSPSIDLFAFYHLTNDGFIRDEKDFNLFLELFGHLNSEMLSQLIQNFLFAQSPEQNFDTVLKLLAFFKEDKLPKPFFQKYLNKHCHSKNIAIQINKLSSNDKYDKILELQQLAKKHSIFYPYFKDFLNKYPDNDLLLVLMHGKNRFAALSLLDFLDDELRLV